MKLFVGNFSFSTTEADLQALFAPYGNIESVAVVTDRQTGRSRGFAPAPPSAKALISAISWK